VTAELGCYVYGVVGSTAAAPDTLPEGVGGTAVERVALDEVAALVSDVPLERPPGRRRDVLAHSAVLDAWAQRGPVVPVRFGSVLEGRDAVVPELLGPRYDDFVALLDDLAGRGQFTVRARYHEPVVLAEVVRENPEIERLREATRDAPEEAVYPEKVRLGELVAQAMEAKRQADAATLLDLVVPHVAAHVVHEGAGVDHLLEAAFLVDDDRRNRFEDALESVAEAMHERAAVRLLGPLAPYDFVAGE